MGKLNWIDIYSSPSIPQGEILIMNKEAEVALDDYDKDALLTALEEIGTPLSIPGSLKVVPTPATTDQLMQEKAAQDLGIDMTKKLGIPSLDLGEVAGYNPPGDMYDVDELDDVIDFYPAEDLAPPAEKKAKKKKKKDDDPDDEPKTKTFKAESMVNGFMLQSNPLAEGKEPFYLEAYLLGADEFYITGGMSGTLNLTEMKEFRKKLKFLINQMKESYPDTEIKKGGKTVIKVSAPWVPTDEQVATIKDLVQKKVDKINEKEEDFNAVDLVTKLVTSTLSQILHEPHDEETLVPAPMDTGVDLSLTHSPAVAKALQNAFSGNNTGEWETDILS